MERPTVDSLRSSDEESKNTWEAEQATLVNAHAAALAGAFPSGPLNITTNGNGGREPTSGIKFPIYEEEIFNGIPMTISAEMYRKLCHENEHQRAELERVRREHAACGNQLDQKNTDYTEVEADNLALSKKITELKSQHAAKLAEVENRHATEKGRLTQNSSTSNQMRQQVLDLQANLRAVQGKLDKATVDQKCNNDFYVREGHNLKTQMFFSGPT